MANDHINCPSRCIIIGMPRVGTTFLFYYLSRHPQLFAPARKEVNYFSVFFERGRKWYDGLYKEIAPQQIGLDTSPFYFLDGRSANRILEEEVDPKVILGIRKPSEMVCSMYERIKSSTPKMPSFESFIENFQWNIGSGLTLQLREFPFSERIKQYQELFGERLLIYNFKVLRQEPLTLLNTIENHLQIESHFSPANFDNRVINASKRRNNKQLSAYLKNEKLIDNIIRFVPRKIINQSRDIFLKASKVENKPESYLLPTRHLEIAKKYLEAQDIRVMEMFESNNFISGFKQRV